LIARININVADIRLEPQYNTERTSQALFNELVDVLEEKEEYYRVRTWDQYEGWIANQFLTEQDDIDDQEPYTVVSNLASAFDGPDPASRRLTSIPYGCQLFGTIIGEFFKVASQRYGDIYIKRSDLSAPGDINIKYDSKSNNLAMEAEKFLGAPYLWGGRSFFGIDCSGFAQTIMKRFGISLPRDTKDQIICGEGVKRKEIKSGDLLFFPRHVTIALSDTQMIHSSLSNGGVTHNSLDSKSPIYSKYLDESFISARRVLE
jgi:uncharacterized protein YgiM (DUF1202 family)